MADVASCGHIIWDTIRSNKDNLTALHETRAPAWVPETEIRGTFSILLTCVVTLAACVYSAIHLNVPLETGFWHTVTRKAAWVVVALVAPELVVLTAMLQFHAAWRLSSDLQQLQKDTEEDKVDKKFVFDLKYAFFIIMGGVRVHTTTLARVLTSNEIQNLERMHRIEHSGERPSDRPTWQLTPKGLLDLAHLGHWVYISPRRISDRSKADGLQKSLILLQVSWMLASCVARKAYGLPLTLLEVHTMVHVVCAFVMYAFWFKKPIDIREPEILNPAEGPEDAMAYLFQRSTIVDVMRSAPRHDEHNVAVSASACERVQSVHVNGLLLKVYDDQDVLKKHQKRYAGDVLAFRPRNVIFDNFRSGAEAQKELMRALGLNLYVVPILYGGIHLTAWAYEFPSEVERLLWRGSSISIMLTLIAWPWYHLTDEVLDRYCRDWLEDAPFFKDCDWVRSVIRWAVTIPVTLILWLAASAVVIASALGRFYLVVEAFISLRAVPVGVYWVPSWLKYIPHV